MMLYTLNLYSDRCQLYLKAGGIKKTKKDKKIFPAVRNLVEKSSPEGL